MFNSILFNLYKEYDKTPLIGVIYLAFGYTCYLISTHLIMVSRNGIVRSVALIPFMIAFVFTVQTATLLVAKAVMDAPVVIADTQKDIQKNTDVFWNETINGRGDIEVEKLLEHYSVRTGINYISASNQTERVVNKVVSSYTVK